MAVVDYFVKKRGVDVDVLIRRTIEGPHSRVGHTACGSNRAREQNQLGWLVAASLNVLAKKLCPDILGILEHNGDKLFGLIVDARRLLCPLCWLTLRLFDQAHERARIGSQKHRDQRP